MNARSSRQHGFTIIEVVLFLAISGLMIAGILAVVGAGINGKRYTEAVDSFQDYLLTSYSATDNVANNTDGEVRCNASAPRPVGTTDCTVIGQLVVSSDGRSITSTPLYAGVDVTEIDREEIETAAELLDAMQLYTVADNPDAEDFSMRWDTRIVANESDATRPFTMMIVRLPYGKGSISYIAERNTQIGSADSLQEFRQVATDANAAEELALCVEPANLQLARPVGVVVDNAASAGSGSLQRRGDVC